MKEIICSQLSLEGIKGLGRYSSLLDCAGECAGKDLIQFFPDLLQYSYNGPQPSFSVVECRKREMLITEAEQHFYASEALLPLNGDVVIFVAPASKDIFPTDKVKAFIVPMGTMVILNEGVWHKAPFPIDKPVVNSLVVLPTLTYINDCRIVSLKDSQWMKIAI